MNVASVKLWLTSGVDEAILNFVKGLFHAALVGAAMYATVKIEGFKPTTPEAVMIYALAYRTWKSFLVYVGITGEVKASVPVSNYSTTTDFVPDSAMGSGL